MGHCLTHKGGHTATATGLHTPPYPAVGTGAWFAILRGFPITITAYTGPDGVTIPIPH